MLRLIIITKLQVIITINNFLALLLILHTLSYIFRVNTIWITYAWKSFTLPRGLGINCFQLCWDTACRNWVPKTTRLYQFLTTTLLPVFNRKSVGFQNFLLFTKSQCFHLLVFLYAKKWQYIVKFLLYNNWILFFLCRSKYLKFIASLTENDEPMKIILNTSCSFYEQSILFQLLLKMIRAVCNHFFVLYYITFAHIFLDLKKIWKKAWTSFFQAFWIV